jgi:hypothetical protein
MKKRFAIILSIVSVAIIMGVLLIPGVIGGSNHTTMNLVRMYSDKLDGEWIWEASETSRWVQEISTYNDQTVITIRPIGDFLWEAPEGTLVFIQTEPVKEAGMNTTASTNWVDGTDGNNGLGDVDWDPNDPYLPIGGS